MRTQVVIIGGGPSGLLLGQLLHNAGIDAVILERKTRDYVLSRIRAGVLERGLVGLLEQAGAAERLKREAYEHDGTIIAYGDKSFRLKFTDYIDKPVTVYGQTEVTRDLYDARERVGAKTLFQVEEVVINDLKADSPSVTCKADGKLLTINCDYVCGCDGFHGVSRQTIPVEVRREFEKVYPFGWLGVLSETPPVNEELIYANSQRGFALCSMRNENLSRYYIQCSQQDSADDWSDAEFWDEIKRRIPESYVDKLIPGDSIEKSVAPLRSFVCEPMQWGRLFLCGDAAHIVPPTGAKGLNTAASDVHYLFSALRLFYLESDNSGIDNYSTTALTRVWKAERFSWWMTSMLHRFPDQSEFDLRIQRAELEFLRENESAKASLAVNYVGLPY